MPAHVARVIGSSLNTRKASVANLGVCLLVALLALFVANTARAHGYVDIARSKLCATAQNVDCGPIRFEPQSLEGSSGLPWIWAGRWRDCKCWSGTVFKTQRTNCWALAKNQHQRRPQCFYLALHREPCDP